MHEVATPRASNTRTARRGTIEVSPQAIATIAGRAITGCAGVIGIAGRHGRMNKAELLPPDRYSRGIEVRFVDERITIDCHIIIEYGLHIADIAQAVMVSVKRAVEQMLGLPVVQVNVIIQGLRVSETPA